MEYTLQESVSCQSEIEPVTDSLLTAKLVDNMFGSVRTSGFVKATLCTTKLVLHGAVNIFAC